MNKLLPSILLSLSSLSAAQNSPPTSPAPCNSNPDWKYQYCSGPKSFQGNAPTRPQTCDGDLVIGVSIFSWKASEDGLEYAIDNRVEGEIFPYYSATDNQLHNLVNAEYKTPHFGWNTGYQVKVGYNAPLEGWDIDLIWTQYKISNQQKIQTAPIGDDDVQENVLLTLWSAFHGIRAASPVFAHKIDTNWKLNLGLLDLELGREYWVSRYLSIRPFISLERAWIEQELELFHEGGYWVGASYGDNQPDMNNEVKIDNDFKGLGVRSGFSTNWHLGCGWSFYSESSAAILYGRFRIDHDEVNRGATPPFSKQKVLDTKTSFHASRPHFGIILGLQYQTLISERKYGLTARLGWEEHLFLHQNQMWRVNRKDTEVVNSPYPNNMFPNNAGENVFLQRRGTLVTGGLTLSLQFAF